MRTHQDGFTLVELVVVLLIVGACLTIVFPKFFTGFVDHQQLQSSVNRIASVAEYAYQRAVCTHTTHLLHFDIEKGKYWVTAQTSDGKSMSIDSSLSLYGKLPEGLQFSRIKFRDFRTASKNVITIEFSPEGWIEPATIYVVSSEGRKMSIILNETLGYVEVSELLK